MADARSPDDLLVELLAESDGPAPLVIPFVGVLGGTDADGVDATARALSPLAICAGGQADDVRFGVLSALQEMEVVPEESAVSHAYEFDNGLGLSAQAEVDLIEVDMGRAHRRGICFDFCSGH